jgi:hypothetical protein
MFVFKSIFITVISIIIYSIDVLVNLGICSMVMVCFGVHLAKALVMHIACCHTVIIPHCYKLVNIFVSSTKTKRLRTKIYPKPIQEPVWIVYRLLFESVHINLTYSMINMDPQSLDSLVPATSTHENRVRDKLGAILDHKDCYFNIFTTFI